MFSDPRPQTRIPDKQTCSEHPLEGADLPRDVSTVIEDSSIPKAKKESVRVGQPVETSRAKRAIPMSWWGRAIRNLFG